MSRSFGRPVYRFGSSKSGAKKTLFQFSFFSFISTKVAISNFTMHLIISKWLRRQKCWENRKINEAEKRWSGKRNSLQKCFHSFKCLLFLLDSFTKVLPVIKRRKYLYCFAWFLLYQLLIYSAKIASQLSQVHTVCYWICEFLKSSTKKCVS